MISLNPFFCYSSLYLIIVTVVFILIVYPHLCYSALLRVTWFAWLCRYGHDLLSLKLLDLYFVK